MAKDKVLMRRNDDSDSGVILARSDVKAFLAAGDNAANYTEESPDVTASNQRKADADVEAKAVEARETENKAVAGPSRNRG